MVCFIYIDCDSCNKSMYGRLIACKVYLEYLVNDTVLKYLHYTHDVGRDGFYFIRPYLIISYCSRDNSECLKIMEN